MVKNKKIKLKKQGEKEGKKNKKIKIFLSVLLILIIIIGIFIFFIQTESKIKKEKIIGNFSFEGFNYTIEDYGKNKKEEKVIFYHTKFLFSKRNITYNLYLRYDPRKNNVSTDINNLKEIKVITYLALDKNFENKSCKELALASYRLSEFLLALGINKEIAIYYENYTLPTYKNLLVISDYNFSENKNVSVIILKYSNKERINNVKNTVIIQSNNCSILQPTEKFILYVIKKLKKTGFILPS